jgi:hypothetical protein
VNPAWLAEGHAMGRELMLRILARWSRLTLALIALTTACICSSSVRAQPSDVETLRRSVSELYRAGKYAEAIPVAKRYLEATKSQYGTEVRQYAVALTSRAN